MLFDLRFNKTVSTEWDSKEVERHMRREMNEQIVEKFIEFDFVKIKPEEPKGYTGFVRLKADAKFCLLDESGYNEIHKALKLLHLKLLSENPELVAVAERAIKALLE